VEQNAMDFAKLKKMEQRLRAVYKDGALHPLEPLQLEDMQQVTVTVDDKPPSDPELSGYFTSEEWSEAARDTITWEDVRRALAGVSGSLSDAVTAQRQER
jgi:predicted DNA-binding antitoxin AbrB/MazE fold protein